MAIIGHEKARQMVGIFEWAKGEKEAGKFGKENREAPRVRERKKKNRKREKGRSSLCFFCSLFLSFER